MNLPLNKDQMEHVEKIMTCFKFIFSKSKREYAKQVDDLSKKLLKLPAGEFMLLANAIGEAVKKSQK